MFTSDRSEQRKYLAEAWGKYNSNHPLEPLELQLAKIIEKHPEYQKIITDIERYRSLVDVLIVYNDSIFAQQETERFNSYLELFRYFTGETDVTPEEDIDIENNLRLLDSN